MRWGAAPGRSHRDVHRSDGPTPGRGTRRGGWSGAGTVWPVDMEVAMAQRLPRRLSPKAKYLLVRADADDRVRTLVSVAAIADSDDLISRVTALGGAAQSWNRETGLLTVDMPA